MDTSIVAVSKNTLRERKSESNWAVTSDGFTSACTLDNINFLRNIN